MVDVGYKSEGIILRSEWEENDPPPEPERSAEGGDDGWCGGSGRASWLQGSEGVQVDCRPEGRASRESRDGQECSFSAATARTTTE